jgi:tetratricopeptide (TPR) repeat protein
VSPIQPGREAGVVIAIALSAGLLCGSISGCAAALKEAPPLSDLAGGGAARSPREVDSLLSMGRLLFARRTLATARQAARAFLQAAAADPARSEGTIEAARVQVWLADHELDAAGRQDAATLAVQAAQWCGRIAPALPACDYWLGAGLGVQARERPATGLSALPRITQAFKNAAAGDPSLDHSGPDRALALLYVRAPGWPAGPGDPDLGLEHARKAVDREPDYPPNLLALAEALAATGDGGGSRETYRRGLELARTLAATDLDASEWIEEAGKALGGNP